MYAELNEGSYFGEIAVLHAVRRTATVTAITYCDLHSLAKVDLDSVLEDFPDIDQVMRKEVVSFVHAPSASNLYSRPVSEKGVYRTSNAKGHAGYSLDLHVCKLTFDMFVLGG